MAWGNSHLVFPKNSWYRMPFAARRAELGQRQWGGGGGHFVDFQGQRSAQEPQGQEKGPRARWMEEH